MKPWAMIAAILALGTIATAAPDARATTQHQPLSPQTISPTLRALLMEFGRALEARDMEQLVGTAARIEAHEQFERLPTNIRQAVLATVTQAHLLEGDIDAAMARAAAVTAIDPTSAIGWEVQMGILQSQGRYADLLLVMAEGVRHSRALREAMDDPQLVGSFIAAAGDQDLAAGADLRRALFDYGWRVDGDDWIWRDYVTDLVLAGDDAGAARVLAEIEAPTVVLFVRGLLRNDAAVALAGDSFPELPEALERDLTRLERAATPGAPVEAFHAYAAALYQRGRFEEALSVADTGLDRPPADDASDDWSYTTWLMDLRSNILQALDRRDEARVQQQAAAGRVEGSGRNVSNAINLGGQLYADGRYEEALAATDGLDSADEASPYGVMQAQSVRYCAAHALGRTDIADAADAYLEEHWRDAPSARLWSLTCRQDADGIAALTIRRLEDPRLAGDAILDFHTFIQVPATSDIDRARRALYDDVLLRPDVQAAFERVGRRLEPQLVTPYL